MYHIYTYIVWYFQIAYCILYLIFIIFIWQMKYKENYFIATFKQNLNIKMFNINLIYKFAYKKL